MSIQIPTDDDIREESVAYLSTEDYDPNPSPMTEDEARARFNVWLAKHDARVSANALRSAAADLAGEEKDEHGNWNRVVSVSDLAYEADQIEEAAAR